jgi:hypothetical protein
MEPDYEKLADAGRKHAARKNLKRKPLRVTDSEWENDVQTNAISAMWRKRRREPNVTDKVLVGCVYGVIRNFLRSKFRRRKRERNFFEPDCDEYARDQNYGSEPLSESQQLEDVEKTSDILMVLDWDDLPPDDEYGILADVLDKCSDRDKQIIRLRVEKRKPWEAIEEALQLTRTELNNIREVIEARIRNAS